MLLQDGITFKGHLKITGMMDGKVLFVEEDHNVITYTGRSMINYALSGNAPFETIETIAVGSGAYLPGAIDSNVAPPAATEADVDLKREEFSKTVYKPVANTTALTSVYQITIGKTEAVGLKLNEWGLRTSTGRLFASRTTKSVTKILNMILVVEWTISS